MIAVLWFGWIDPYVIVLTIVSIIIAAWLLKRLNAQEDAMMVDYYKSLYGDRPDVWIEYADGVSVGIKAWQAYSMNEDDFYKFYMDQMQYNKPDKAVARAWARKQIESREEAETMAWYMGDDDGVA